MKRILWKCFRLNSSRQGFRLVLFHITLCATKPKSFTNTLTNHNAYSKTHVCGALLIIICLFWRVFIVSMKTVRISSRKTISKQSAAFCCRVHIWGYRVFVILGGSNQMKLNWIIQRQCYGVGFVVYIFLKGFPFGI